MFLTKSKHAALVTKLSDADKLSRRKGATPEEQALAYAACAKAVRSALSVLRGAGAKKAPKQK